MSRELVIDSFHIQDDGECYVIAEIGHNHQGQLETAKELFRAAKECGAHAVKLQKRDNRTLYTKEMYNKPYDHENSYGATYGLHREFLEFGKEEYQELKNYAQEIGITFFATAFDFRSADFLMEFDMPAVKIASGDLTNIPLLKYVAGFQKPIILSTGGGTMEDVRRAYDAVMSINPQLCLLQCTAGYPCEWEEMNLRVITMFREQFPDVAVGLSGHDSGIAMAVAAYALGGRVIEKHFTLNRAMRGTDHAFSLERPGLQKMVRDLHRAHLALGDGVKRTYLSERAPILKMAKKLVAARDVPAGHVLTREDIAIKSPSDGLPPYELDNVLGKVTLRPLQEDEDILFDHLMEGHRNGQRRAEGSGEVQPTGRGDSPAAQSSGKG
jgi:sialic acid synthase